MDKYSPIVLIRSSKPSFWDSCISIVDNLEASYRLAFSDRVRIFYYDDNLSEPALINSLKKLHSELIDEFVVIDHYPPLTNLLKAINIIWKENLPKLTLHTFGGFSYRCDEYEAVVNIFKKFPLKIVAPSTRATEFLMQHIQTENDLFHTVPFAISRNEFNFQKDLRSQARKTFNLAPDSEVIIYAGRIAADKNVFLTLRLMLDYLKLNPKAVFLIAGQIDDSSVPGFKAGECEKVEAVLNDPKLDPRIRYLGKLNQNEIKQFYHASDITLSLSTYPLEDFGMGPLEALACGSPVILTKWGGYSDFSLSEDHCRLMNVSITDRGLKIHHEKLFHFLDDFLAKRKSDELREIRSQRYLDQFSVETVANKIKELHSKSYVHMEGFTPMARAYKWLNGGEKLSQLKNTFYHSLYGSFFE